MKACGDDEIGLRQLAQKFMDGVHRFGDHPVGNRGAEAADVRTNILKRALIDHRVAKPTAPYDRKRAAANQTERSSAGTSGK